MTKGHVWYVGNQNTSISISLVYCTLLLRILLDGMMPCIYAYLLFYFLRKTLVYGSYQYNGKTMELKGNGIWFLLFVLWYHSNPIERRYHYTWRDTMLYHNAIDNTLFTFILLWALISGYLLMFDFRPNTRH